MIKRVVVAFLIIAYIFSLTSCSNIWCLFTGFEFYDGDEIKEIIPYETQLYIVTENALYIEGGYERTDSKAYRNVELYEDEALGLPKPVLLFEGKISQIIPIDDLKALIITDEGKLYKFDEFEVALLHENIVCADSWYAQDCIYAVDSNHKLISIENGESKIIADGINDVEVYRDRIFAINNSAQMREVLIENERVSFGEVLFEGASSFEIEDTSVRYDGKKIVFDNEEAINTPLFNVLDTDNRLYAKGVYNLLACGSSSSSPIPMEFLDEWTLISENVQQFSLAKMGTAFKLEDGTCAYYGFETNLHADSNFEYKTLSVSNASNIYATSLLVCANSINGHYIWGNNFYKLFYGSSEHNVLSGTPYVLKNGKTN